MPRALVVVDLDDVLFDFVKPFFAWHNRRYGTNLSAEDLATARYLYEAWGGTSEEAVERVRLFYEEVDILDLEPMAGAVACLERLNGTYRLALVSAKDPDFAAVTETWIERYFAGVFDPVMLGIGHSERGERQVTKADVCRELGATILIDDQVGHFTGAARDGVRALVFGGHPWNRDEPLPPNALRVADWSEVCNVLI